MDNKIFWGGGGEIEEGCKIQKFDVILIPDYAGTTNHTEVCYTPPESVDLLLILTCKRGPKKSSNLYSNKLFIYLAF